MAGLSTVSVLSKLFIYLVSISIRIKAEKSMLTSVMLLSDLVMIELSPCAMLNASV